MENLPPDLQQLVLLVRRVDDRQQLGELISRYGMAVDDRDFDTLARLFASDGEFNGVKGRETIIDYYRERTSAFTTSSHYADTWHFDLRSDTRASGVVNAHAELCIGGKAIRIVLRYLDTYTKGPDGWMFQARVIRFRYVLPFDAVADGLDDLMRVRWPGQPAKAADLPDLLQTYIDSRKALAAGAPVPPR